MVEIGKLYKLELQVDQLDFTVKRASDALQKKYPTYADLNGKVVIVLSKDKKSTNVKAGLVEKNKPLDDFWFTIKEKWLVPIGDGCACSIRLLMCRGCVCGAFEKEQSQNNQDNKKTKPKPTNYEPW